MRETKSTPVTDVGVFGAQVLGKHRFIGHAHLRSSLVDGGHFYLTALAKFPAGFIAKHFPCRALG